MRAWKWVLLAALGLALLYYVRRRQAAGAGASGAAPAFPPVRPAPLVDPSKLPPPTDTVNVAFDVTGDLDHFVLSDDVQFNKEVYLWQQVMRPAGRVRLHADIPQSYWVTMLHLLSLDLSRRDDLSHRNIVFQGNIVDQQTGEAINSVVGAIVDAVAGIVGGPLVGAVLGYATQQVSRDLAAAIAAEQATATGLDSIRQSADPKKLSKSTQWILQRGAGNVDDLAATLGLPGGSNLFESPSWNGPPQPWHTGDGGTYFFQERWFTLTPIGLFMPWLSREMLGATLQDTCNNLARVARALDAFQCMTYPLEPTGAYQGVYYWYRNKVFGDIKGSIFPPTAEDTYYVNASGVRFSYDGKPMLDPHVVAITVAGPFDIPGYTPPPGSAEASQGGDGGEFAPRKAPPGTAVQAAGPLVAPPSAAQVAQSIGNLTVPPPPSPAQAIGGFNWLGGLGLALTPPPNTPTPTPGPPSDQTLSGLGALAGLFGGH